MEGGAAADRFVRSSRLAARQVGPEYVVLQLDRHLAVALDDAARTVLEALREPARPEDLAGQLAGPLGAELDVPGLSAFLAEVAALGLVDRVEGAEAGAGLASREPAAEGAGVATAADLVTPRVLWAERLEHAVHQPSPPVLITVPRCRP